MKKIKVLIKKPGQRPYITYISNTLSNLQKTVDGFIECVTLAPDVVVICDEEGRLKDYPFCCCISGIEFVGTVVVVGCDKYGDFIDLPDNKFVKDLFTYLCDEDLYIDFFDPDELYSGIDDN